MIDRPEAALDATFGGYVIKHARPPAFEGSDGAAYTASVYASDFPDEGGMFGAALLFVRWSSEGDRPTGHVETPVIARAPTKAQATAAVEAKSLHEVKALLDESIRVSQERPDW